MDKGPGKPTFSLEAWMQAQASENQRIGELTARAADKLAQAAERAVVLARGLHDAQLNSLINEADRICRGLSPYHERDHVGRVLDLDRRLVNLVRWGTNDGDSQAELERIGILAAALGANLALRDIEERYEKEAERLDGAPGDTAKAEAKRIRRELMRLELMHTTISEAEEAIDREKKSGAAARAGENGVPGGAGEQIRALTELRDEFALWLRERARLAQEDPDKSHAEIHRQRIMEARRLLRFASEAIHHLEAGSEG